MDSSVNVDDLFTALGKWGRYQLFHLLILLVGIWTCAFQLLIGAFTGYRSDFLCMDPYITHWNDSELVNNSYLLNNQSQLIIEQCRISRTNNTSNVTSISYTSCPNGYNYSLPKERTFTSEWDLVCEKAPLAEFAQTLLMIGQAFGAAVFTSLADRYGRKKINIFCHIGVSSVGVGLAFAPNYMTFAALRLFLGALQQGLAMTTAVMALEVLPMESRFMSEILGLLFWTTGVALVSPFAYVLRNYSWRYTQLTISLASSHCLFHFWILDESIRWLLNNNKIKEATRVVKKAARWNKVNYDDVMDQVRKARVVSEKKKYKLDIQSAKTEEKDLNSVETRLIVNSRHEDEKRVEETLIRQNSVDKKDHQGISVEKLNATHIFRNKRIFINSLIMWFAWNTNSLTYYGLTLTSTSLAGNRYVNYLLSAIVEYPAALGEFIMLNRIGRKRTCILFHLTAGASLTVATVCNYFSDGDDYLTIIITVFTLLGKMAITGSFSTIFLYTPELYPTNLRNVGIGFASAAARFGSMAAPFAGTLALYLSWGPGAICAVMCLTVGCLSLYLPETKGHELPQTLLELKQWYKDHSGRKTKKAKRSTLTQM